MKNPRPAGSLPSIVSPKLPDVQLHAEPGDEPDQQERRHACDDEEPPGEAGALLAGGETDDELIGRFIDHRIATRRRGALRAGLRVPRPGPQAPADGPGDRAALDPRGQPPHDRAQVARQAERPAVEVSAPDVRKHRGGLALRGRRGDRGHGDRCSPLHRSSIDHRLRGINGSARERQAGSCRSRISSTFWNLLTRE
jgi:hypothetical protein